MAAPLTMQQLGWFEWEVYRLQRTSSALPASVKVASSQYTATDDDWYIFAAGLSTIFLPRPEARAGHEYVVKLADGNGPAVVQVTGTPPPALIDGLPHFRLRAKDESVTVVSDGSQWRTVNYVRPPSPEQRVVVYDDFLSLDGNTAGTDVVSSHSWRTAGATPGVAAVSGHVRVDGDGSTQGRFELTRDGTLNLVTDNTAALDFRTRVAQRGTSAGTRRFGLAGAALTSDPSAGMYFRHTNGGNYTCVVRNATLETTEDSGVAASDGAFHTFRITDDGLNTVYFYIDGSVVATFDGDTANVPVGQPLGICFASGGTGANTGLTVDYVYLEHDRSLV